MLQNNGENYTEKASNMYSSFNITEVIKSTGVEWETCNTHGEMNDEYKIFVKKPQGTRPFGRPELRG
jgi:hypothetical protein